MYTVRLSRYPLIQDSLNGLARQAREEAERSRQGVPREVLEGVLDKGVFGQPDYIHHPDYWSVKIQD